MHNGNQIELTENDKKPYCRSDADGNYYFDFHIFVNEVDTGNYRAS